MKRKNYLICLLTAIILLPIGVQAKDKKKGKKNIPMSSITSQKEHYTRICPLRPVAVKQQATKT